MVVFWYIFKVGEMSSTVSDRTRLPKSRARRCATRPPRSWRCFLSLERERAGASRYLAVDHFVPWQPAERDLVRAHQLVAPFFPPGEQRLEHARQLAAFELGVRREDMVAITAQLQQV